MHNICSDDMLFEVIGEVKNHNGNWTNVTMILDDNSEGHNFVSELMSKFEWRDVEESEPFGSVNIEKH